MIHQVVATLLFLCYSFMSFIQDEPYLYDNHISYKCDLNFRKRFNRNHLFHSLYQVIIRPGTSSIIRVTNSTSSKGVTKSQNAPKPVVKVNKFAELDLSESRSSQYIKDTSHTILKDYANEKMCFTWLLGDYAQDLPVSKYKVARSKVWIVFIPRYN